MERLRMRYKGLETWYGEPSAELLATSTPT
jgi:hypothetical protein